MECLECKKEYEVLPNKAVPVYCSKKCFEIAMSKIESKDRTKDEKSVTKIGIAMTRCAICGRDITTGGCGCAIGAGQQVTYVPPAAPQGWQCPICKSVYSPAFYECLNCNRNKARQDDNERYGKFCGDIAESG